MVLHNLHKATALKADDIKLQLHSRNNKPFGNRYNIIRMQPHPSPHPHVSVRIDVRGRIYDFVIIS